MRPARRELWAAGDGRAHPTDRRATPLLDDVGCRTQHWVSAQLRLSCIDLLVVLPQVASKHQTAVAMRRSLADLPMGKDIVVATPEDIARRGYIVGTVLNQAITEGKVLYEQA